MRTANNVLRGLSYQEKLQTGAWKAFSRHVRNVKGNCCEICKRTNIELNVHHWFYENDKEPEDYKLSEVALLCRPCHNELHEHLNNFRKFVFPKMTPQIFRVINGALTVALDKYDPAVFAHALAEFVGTPSLVQRYAESWDRDAMKKSEEQAAYDKFKRSLTGKLEGQ